MALVGQNLIGRTFGRMQVIGRRRGGAALWFLKCECYNFASSPTGNLTSERKTSCGCGRSDWARTRSESRVSIGSTQGRLTVTGERSSGGRLRLITRCRCMGPNDRHEVLAQSWRAEKTGGSCGCIAVEKRLNAALRETADGQWLLGFATGEVGARPQPTRIPPMPNPHKRPWPTLPVSASESEPSRTNSQFARAA